MGPEPDSAARTFRPADATHALTHALLCCDIRTDAVESGCPLQARLEVSPTVATLGGSRSFGELLRRYRQATRLTQAEQAKRAGLSERGSSDEEWADV